MVECQLPKLDVAGSTPVSRSNFFSDLQNPASLCAPFVLRLYDERRLQLLDGTFFALPWNPGIDAGYIKAVTKSSGNRFGSIPSSFITLACPPHHHKIYPFKSHLFKRG